MDNLKELKENVDTVIPIGGGIASVKTVNHNPFEKQVIEKVGRYTGFPFTSGRSPSLPITAGQFFWNNNAMNKTDAFDITMSKFTQDGNDIERILNLCFSGTIIHFKDFVGRSTILEFVSFINTDNVLTVTVKGFAENTDYNYQIGELEPCMIEFFNTSNGIPLSGTIEGFPVYGDIELMELIKIKSFDLESDVLRSIYFTDSNEIKLDAISIGSVAEIIMDSTAITIQINNIDTSENIGLSLIGNKVQISSVNGNSRGLIGALDFTPNITDLDFVQKKYVDGFGIPLNGTTVGNPVSGDIELSDGIKLFITDGSIRIGGESYGISFPNDGSVNNAIISYPSTSKGLSGDSDYTQNITDLDYTQKKYVDNPLIRTISASTTLTNNDKTINISSGTFTQNIYTANGNLGKILNFANNGNGIVTLNPNSTETINGISTLIIPSQTGISIQSDGTNWVIINKFRFETLNKTQWIQSITTTTIANASSLNLLTLVTDVNKLANGTDGGIYELSVASNSILTKWHGEKMTHHIRLSGTIVTGTDQHFLLTLRRTLDDSVLGVVQLNRNSDTGFFTADFLTYTYSETDPFVTNGFYFQIDNNSGVSVDISTSINLLITTYFK